MPSLPCRSLTLALLSLWLPLGADAAEGEGAATKPVTVKAGDNKLTVSEVAASGTVGSVVGITTRPDGRIYVTETQRRTNAAIDIRKNGDWLMDTLASTSIDDKRALIHRRMSDWKKLEAFKERIWALDDTDGDGKADKVQVAFEGFGRMGLMDEHLYRASTMKTRRRPSAS